MSVVPATIADTMTGQPASYAYRRSGLKPIGPATSAIGGGRSPYRLGYDFERSVRTQLERRGWFVRRSGASKTKVDLLAVSADRPHLFIQCKRRGVISSGEWNELWEIAREYGGIAMVCSRLSPRTTGFFRLDGPREPRKRGRPWTQVDPLTLKALPVQTELALAA